MKIVHIISSLKIGGAETMLARLIRGMPQHTHVVITLTTVGPLGESLKASGCTVYGIRLRATTAWHALPRLWSLIQQESPDIVQTWMYHADLLGGLISRLAGVKQIVWNVRNTEIPQGRLSMTGLIVRLCAISSNWLPKAIICCAHAGLEVHAARGYKRQKMLVIPNGYDIHDWQPKRVSRSEMRRDYGLPSKAFIVGIVGRYDSLKGYDVFIEAADRIAKVVHNAIFLMIGRHVDSSNVELLNLIESHGGDATFRLLGERSDVSQLMSTMDVYCLSSRAEGFPNVVAEAMLMQVPCVVANVGDAARIVGATGRVVPPGDPDALAEAVKTLESYGEEWLQATGEAARQRIVNNYSIDTVSKQYEQLYEHICEETESGMKTTNRDSKTVAGFGDEWERFDQSELDANEHKCLFDKYFSIFPWQQLPPAAQGFDMGCGSGRWAKLASQRVGTLHCIDPSSAINVARRNLADIPNCVLHAAGVEDKVLPDNSMDFGYSLGVLHHIPDTARGLRDCVRMLKPGAPFLLYLYYALDNRSLAYRVLWKSSDLLRRVISALPHGPRFVICQLIAALIYWPMARFGALMQRSGMSEDKAAALPLGFYRHLSFYTMRTDALDRFGTRLEHRFTRKQILQIMQTAGLENIRFSESDPYWCAVGFKNK